MVARWLALACLLLTGVLHAQGTGAVSFAWALASDHSGATFEAEIDGALVVPCPDARIDLNERVCGPVPVSLVPHTFRLRAVLGDAVGPWSESATWAPSGGGGGPPGAFTIALIVPSIVVPPPPPPPGPSIMPTFDSAAGLTSGSASSLTIAHTLGSGANRVVYAFVHSGDRSFTATYNGVSMTELYDGTPGSPFRYIAVYRMLEADLPSAGTYNVVFTPSSSGRLAGGVISFADVDQTTPNRTPSIATGAGATSTATPASEVGDLVLDMVTRNTDVTGTVGADQTARVNVANGDEFVSAMASTEPGASTSTTMTWTGGGTGAWTVWSAALVPAAGGEVYSLTLDPASVTVAGTAVGLRAARRVTLSPASLAVTGQAVGVRATRRLTLSPASVAASGAAVGLRAARRLALDPATVAATGADVSLIVVGGYTLTLDPASIALTGTAVGLRAARRLTLSPASVAVTGAALTFRRGYRLDAQPATVAVSGAAVGLSRGLRFALDPAGITVTGQAVTLRATRRLTLGAATLALAGADLGLIRVGSYVLTLDAATVAVSGSAVGLQATRRLALAAGTVAASGAALGLRATRRLTLDPAAVALTGSAVSLVRPVSLVLDAAAVSITGRALTLRADRRLPLDALVVEVTGGALVFDYTGALIGTISLAGAYTPILAVQGAWTPTVPSAGAYTPALAVDGSV